MYPLKKQKSPSLKKQKLLPAPVDISPPVPLPLPAKKRGGGSRRTTKVELTPSPPLISVPVNDIDEEEDIDDEEDINEEEDIDEDMEEEEEEEIPMVKLNPSSTQKIPPIPPIQKTAIPPIQKTAIPLIQTATSPIQKTAIPSIQKTTSIETDDMFIDATLKKMGFIPLAKILKENKDVRTKELIAYIKVLSPRGEKALVQLDKEGMKSKVFQGDVVYVTSEEPALMIPSTAKTGYSRCTNPSVCGLVLECDGEICTISREGTEMIPQEISFTLMSKEKPAVKSALISSTSGVMAYPIVRFSEILMDSEAVTDNIHENTVDIHKYAIRMNYTTSEELKDVLQSYPEKIAKFTEMQGNILQEIGSVINELNSYYDEYRNEGTGESFETVKKNLRMYNDLYTKIIQDGQWLISIRVMDQFARFSSHLTESIDYIEKISPSIGEVLTD